MVDGFENDVLLVGRSPAIQELLKGAVEQCGVLAGSVAANEDSVDALQEHTCRLLVIDMDGDTADPLRVVAASREAFPPMPILALVERDDIPTAVRAMQAGATDCLEKPIEQDHLRSVVESLLSQGTSRPRSPKAVLTSAQTAVLRGILEGKTNREIGEALHRSQRTIEIHRRKMMHRLGASNVVDLVRQAATMGLSNPGPPST